VASILLPLLMLFGLIGGTLGQPAATTSHQVTPLQTAEIAVGGVPLTVELAYQPADMARGLSYRDGLAPGAGMLFLYLDSDYRTYHMGGMRFCLDFIWIDNDMIVGTTKDICPSPAGTPEDQQPTYRSPAPVMYVLEVPAGWLAANGLDVGAPVTNLPRLVMREQSAP
jgi:uncharacterized membrane protein (UPF0127 family)